MAVGVLDERERPRFHASVTDAATPRQFVELRDPDQPPAAPSGVALIARHRYEALLLALLA